MINILFSIMTQHSSFVAIDISRKEQRNFPVEIYRSTEGNIELNVKLENDTFGLHKVKWQSCLLLTEHLLHDTFATFTRVKNYTKSQLVQKMHKFLLYLYMIFGKNVYLCMQNEENGHIISIFPVADLRCRLYSIALSSFVRRNRRYG